MDGPLFSPRQRARFSPPRPLEGELERPRLLEAVLSNSNRKLTLLCAAPGYGKTVLAAQFARAADFPVAWLQLDSGGRDPSVFCSDILQALRFALRDWEAPTMAWIGAAGGAVEPAALGSALSAALDRSLPDFTALVIDDYHLVDDSQPAGEFFNAVLQELPPALHLLLISRHIPTLRITPLVAAQQVAGFSEEHLRFSPGEVQELVAARNHISLPPAEAEALVSANEGWVTGILLSSHLLWRGLPLSEGLVGRDRIFQFLASEVLEQQPDPLRRFMLEASILQDMDAPACDFVLGRTDSRDWLHQLDDRRLFVAATGDDPPAYRFHNLFREFLVSRMLQRDPERGKQLRERAGEWHLQAGMPELAFSYFVQAENLPRAARLAEEHVRTYYESGRFRTLQEWARRLYPIRFEAPVLYGCTAMTFGMSGDYRKAEEYLEIAAGGIERARDDSRRHSLETTRAWIAFRRGNYVEGRKIADGVLRKGEAGGVALADLRMAAEHAGRCAAASGDLTAAVSYLRQAVAKFPAEEKSYDRAHVITELANTLQANGDTAEAYILQRRALALWRELGFPGPIAIALNNLAFNQHMLGQLEEAEASYAEAMEWSRKSGDKHSQMLILAGLGDLMKDRGQYWKAGGYYASADRLAEENGDVHMLGYVYRAWADLNRWLKNYPAAMEWLQRAGELAESETEIQRAKDRVLRGVLVEETGRSAEAVEILEEAVEVLERKSTPKPELAEAFFLLSRSYFRIDNRSKAETLLRRALDLAFVSGSDQYIIRQVGCAQDMLSAFASHPNLGGLCVSILERYQHQKQAVAEPEGESVTPDREKLAVHALGSLRISWDGRDIPRAAWVSQKTKELFLYIVDRAPAPRDELIAVFWPEMPSGRAQANLYQTLYRIRRAVGADVLALKNQVCRLTDDVNLAYDVADFEKAARNALALPVTDRKRTAALNGAAELFQGEYLQDVPVDWTSQRREELNQLFLSVIRELADECITLCRYEEGRAAVARGLELDPFRDDLHQRMLRILAALGRKHEVVDHYQRYVAVLRSDLGLDPPLETRALYDSLIS